MFITAVNEAATSFQYAAYDQDYDFADLVFMELEDCNVTVAFVNDSALIYTLDIGQYESGEAFIYGTHVHLDDGLRFLSLFLLGLEPIKSITVTLGTAIGYDLYFDECINLNATVTYANGAVLGGRKVGFSYSGILNFKMTENVNYESGIDLYIGGPSVEQFRADYVNLNISLAGGLNGRLAFLDGNYTIPCNYSVLEMDGWEYRDTIPIPHMTKNRVNVTYSTDSIENPLLDLWISALYAVAYLK